MLLTLAYPQRLFFYAYLQPFLTFEDDFGIFAPFYPPIFKALIALYPKTYRF